MKTPIFKYYDPFNGEFSKPSNEFSSMGSFFDSLDRAIAGKNKPELVMAIDRVDSNRVGLFVGDIVQVSYEHQASNFFDDESTSGHLVGVIRYQPSKGFVISKIIDYADDAFTGVKQKGVSLFSSCATTKIGNKFENADLLLLPKGES